MASPYLTFDSIAQSNMRSHEKNALAKWWDDIKPNLARGPHSTLAAAHHAGKKTLHVVRTGGESLVFGAALGLAHANLPTGLDVPVKGMSIPLDALLGIAGSIGALAAGSNPDGVGVEMLTGANSSWTILGFRKTMDISAEIKAKTGGVNKGTVGILKAGTPKVAGEDPIIAAGKEFLKR